MAEIKNFGLHGVASDLQLGKAGPRLKVNGNAVEALSANGEELVSLRGANAIAESDFVTLGQVSNLMGEIATDGFGIELGDIIENGDGSWQPGAVPLTNQTKVSDAVDSLNEILGKLIPSAPPAFPNGALTVANSAGSSPRLAASATDNAASSLTAGATVTRITAAGVNSNMFSGVGAGESGTVSALMNGTILGSRVLNGIDDNGSYSGLVISGQADFPIATPGFWKSINVALTNAAAPVGVNKIQITHTEGGNTSEVYFVRDDITATPVVSAGSVAENNAVLAYSSGVPHYTTGSSLTVGASISNLAGQTYYGGTDPLVISGQNGIIASDTLAYSAVGISTPIAANTTSAVAITPVTVNIDGTNVHNAGKIQAVAKNVNGSSAATDLSASQVLVMVGTTTRLSETSVPVTGLGSAPNALPANRVGMAAGDKPLLATTAWDSAGSLQAHDAAVVGGVLRHDQTDYSAGYLPAGPNLSVGRSGSQYITYAFRRSALSQFKINVTGTYAGCWIALPSISDAQPNGNGWWNGFQPYDGAGTPGEAGDALAGCAAGTVMSGSTGVFTMTFGTASSTNSTDNLIYVRFKLNAGQAITALSFTN